ncbi:MAG TPA: glutathione S-transferase C-terminal domain-containing protein [Myxococcaceae bacterium]|nr:glutathione S-transferase C-terminal domain-containing protein [Myxococcaceae bacterium]
MPPDVAAPGRAGHPLPGPKKYGIQPEADAHHASRIRSALQAVREALADGRRRLLPDGRFSFADITVATSLQFLLPVGDGYMPLGTATREVWTHPELADEFADLLAWRDEVYDAHRPPPAQH